MILPNSVYRELMSKYRSKRNTDDDRSTFKKSVEKRNPEDDVAAKNLDDVITYTRMVNGFSLLSDEGKIDNDVLAAELLNKDFEVSPGSTKKEDIESLPGRIIEARKKVKESCEAAGKPCEEFDIIPETADGIMKLGETFVPNPDIFNDGTTWHALKQVAGVAERADDIKKTVSKLIKYLKNEPPVPVGKEKDAVEQIVGKISELVNNEDPFTALLTKVKLNLLERDMIQSLVNQMILYEDLPNAIRNTKVNKLLDKVGAIGELVKKVKPYLFDETMSKLTEMMKSLFSITDAHKFPTTKKRYVPGFFKGAKDLNQLFEDVEKKLNDMLYSGVKPKKLKHLFSSLKLLNDEIKPAYAEAQKLKNTVPLEQKLKKEISDVQEELKTMEKIEEYGTCVSKIDKAGGLTTDPSWYNNNGTIVKIADSVVDFVDKCNSTKLVTTELLAFRKEADANKGIIFERIKKKTLGNVISELETIHRSLETLTKHEIVSRLNKASTAMSDIENLHGNPEFQAALSCIQNKPLHDNMKNVMDTTTMKLALKQFMSNSKDDAELEEAAKNALNFYAKYMKFREYLKNAKLTHEELVGKAKDGAKIAKDLSLYLKRYHDIYAAQAAKKDLDALLKARNLIDRDIEKLSDPELKKKLERFWNAKTIKTLENLPKLIEEMNQKFKFNPTRAEQFKQIFNSTVGTQEAANVDLESIMEGFREGKIQHLDPEIMSRLEQLNLEFASSQEITTNGLKAFMLSLPLFANLSSRNESAAGQISTDITDKKSDPNAIYYAGGILFGLIFTFVLIWYCYNFYTIKKKPLCTRAKIALIKSFCPCKYKPDGVIDTTIVKEEKVTKVRYFKGENDEIYMKPASYDSKTYKSVRLANGPKMDMELDATQVLDFKTQIEEATQLAEDEQGIHNRMTAAAQNPPLTKTVVFKARDEFPVSTLEGLVDLDIDPKTPRPEPVFIPPSEVYDCGKGYDKFQTNEAAEAAEAAKIAEAVVANAIKLTEEQIEQIESTALSIMETSSKVCTKKKSDLSIDVTQDSTKEGRASAGADKLADPYMLKRKNMLHKWTASIEKIYLFYVRKLEKLEFGGRNFEDIYTEEYFRGVTGALRRQPNGHLSYLTLGRGLSLQKIVHHLGCLKDQESVKSYQPIFPASVAIELMRDAKEIFKTEDAVLKLNRHKIRAVGDTHGALDDFARHLEIGLDDLTSTYLYLGDYVDRGPNSIPIVVFLSILKCADPRRYYFLRGNHEFAMINANNHGFVEECIRVYGYEHGKAFFMAANEMFEEMPVAAILQDRVWCAHGGISPHMKEGRKRFLELVKKKPTNETEMQVLIDILWSDPCPAYRLDQKNPILFRKSPRTKDSVVFTPHGLYDALNKCGFDFIIRGHECKQNGFELFCATKCVTVFSKTNNDGDENMGCQMIIDSNLKCEFILFKNHDRVVVSEKEPLTDDGETSAKKGKKVKKEEKRSNNSKSANSKSSLLKVGPSASSASVGSNTNPTKNKTSESKFPPSSSNNSRRSKDTKKSKK
ncbi:unnamed protein product [Caenorhabditis nigoni]